MRTTQRRQPKVRADGAALTEAIVRLATRYGRYGVRRFRRLLVVACVNAEAGNWCRVTGDPGVVGQGPTSRCPSLNPKASFLH